MPGDITGTEIIEEDPATGKRNFRFVHGPIFANVVLADEINRTPPKTQAALLQAMQEHQVTAAGQTYPLPAPFFVLATQNPIEQEGTYPLPEAQLDRFMLELRVGYPSRDEEEPIVEQTTGQSSRELSAGPRRRGARRDAARWCAGFGVSKSLIRAAVLLARMTRPATPTRPPWSASSWSGEPARVPSQYLVLGAKARAAMDGRPMADLDDVRAVAPAVLRHRVVTNFAAEAAGRASEDVVKELVAGGAWGK